EAGGLTVKLLDFGIAKIKMDRLQGAHETGLTQTGSMLGSPHYMSPEQAKGLKSIDHRTDIWSLGVVLYKALSGSTPFRGDSLGQLILAICSEPIPPLRRVAPWVSSAVARIVERALQRAPSDRFASATELFEALRQQLPDGYDIQ